MTVTTVILESDDPSPVLIESVSARFFDTLGAFVTSGSTDGSGEVIVDIPDADYDLYFYKKSVSINDGMPQRITVDAADPDTPPNTFKVIAHIASLPEAVDPALCRISGYLRGSDGRPSRDGRLVFRPIPEAGYVDGDLLSPQNYARVVPNEDGYYEFDLIRNINYCGYFVAMDRMLNGAVEPAEFDVRVPDLPALRVKDLMFPVPISCLFTPDTLALNVEDEDDSVVLAISYSDGSERSTPPTGVSVSLSVDNEDPARIELSGSSVVVTALAVGVVNVTLERTLTELFVYDPLPTFTSGNLEVTVS